MQLIPEAKNGQWKKLFSIWVFAVIGGIQAALTAAGAVFASLPAAERMAWLQDPDTLRVYFLAPAALTTAAALIGGIARMIQQNLGEVDDATAAQ